MVMMKKIKERNMNKENLIVIDKASMDGIGDDLTYMLIEIKNGLEPISKRLEKVSEVAPTLIKIQNDLGNLSEEIVEKIDSKSLESINEALSKLKSEISSLSNIVTVSVDDVTKKAVADSYLLDNR